MIYSLLIMVTLKYVVFILMADSNGEGGTFALLSLVQKAKMKFSSKVRQAFIILSIVGASFVIGDGAFTPAISVLSAMEGLETFSRKLHYVVVPLTIAIVLVLFLSQQYGTSKVGLSFSPVMVLWFLTLAILGSWRIFESPAIFKALNPVTGIKFLLYSKENGGFLTLAAVFLAVTGLEALYADIGHFGKNAVRLSWCSFVLPSLILNYLGQGALLLKYREFYVDPFYHMTPAALYWPIFILSIFATIIASQAMITGCFSLVSQAISLGLMPPLTITHTSTKVVCNKSSCLCPPHSG